MPQAVMNEDWQSFTLVLSESSYYLGNTSPLDGETIYLCRNRMFSENWSSYTPDKLAKI